MAQARMGAGLIAGCLLLATASAWAAPPTVAQMLSFRPKQDGVVYSNPTPQEQEKCKVELQKAARGSSWLLRDETGQVLRRYSDSNGDNKINVWSFFYKGVEVYRELDTNANGK